MQRRKYPRSGRRSIIDYANVISRSGEYAILCVNRGIVDIARVFLSQRGMWATSYSVAYHDDGYDVPTDVQLAVVEELISEFLEDTAQMDCSDFLASLDAIGTAIEALRSGSGGCGCGSSGSGAEEETATSETVDPPGTPGGSYPAGFSTIGQYETYKCAVATWVVDGLATQASIWAGVDLTAATLAVFVGLMILPVPGSRLIALLAAVLALTGLGAGVLTDLISAINNNRDDLICSLFEAEDVSGAQSAFETAMDASIDGESADVVWRFAVKQVYKLLVSNDIYNKLFIKDAYTDFGTGDCSSCTQTPIGTIVWGDPDDDIEGLGTFQIDAVPGSGWGCTDPYIISISWNQDVDIDLSLVSGSPQDCNSNGIYKIWDGPNFTGSVVMNGNTFSGPYTGQSLRILSKLAGFTFDIEVA